MKNAILLAACIALALIGGSVLIRELDPNVRAYRAWELAADQAQAAALQPWLLRLKIVAVISGAAASAGFSAAAIIASCAVAISIWHRRHRVYPWRGVYPAYLIVPGLTARLLNRLLGLPIPEPQYLAAPNEPRAQMLGAFVQGNLTRIGAGPIRAMLRDDAPDAILPDLVVEPPLPDYASAYTAALPPQLGLPLGVTAAGPVSVPLLDMGSVVIGGLPGYGKSEFVASMIVNLMRQDPDGRRVRLAIADLKGGLDFGHIPDDLAAMEFPVARDPETALHLTERIWQITEERQRIVYAARDAHIETYNQRHSDQIPYLVFVIDELMIMSMAASDRGSSAEDKARAERFNSLLIKIGSLSRAVGVSIVGATQKPSAQVIPTQFRDICGLGVAFWCSRNHQSIAILGESGAEDLPAQPGVALTRLGDGQLTRIRTYHAGIKERRFLNFVEHQPRADRPQLPAGAPAGPPADGEFDASALAVSPRIRVSASVPVPPEPLDFIHERALRNKPIPVPTAEPPPWLDDLIYQRWIEARQNLSEAQRRTFGYDGGAAYYVAARAVNRALHAAGQPIRYSIRPPDDDWS